MTKIQNSPLLLKSLLWAIGVSLLLLMISQIASTVTTRRSIAEMESIYISLAFAIGLDLFTVIAIAIGWRWCAAGASIITACINVLCYNKFDYSTFEAAKLAYTSILISCVQPVVVYAYSEILHRLQESQVEGEVQRLQMQLAEQDIEIERLKMKRTYNKRITSDEPELNEN